MESKGIAVMESIYNLHGKKTLTSFQMIENCDIIYRVHEGGAL